ncbi:uncharacterized protein E0L32_007608 [Thyridium curvatum]|uniref:SMP-30/Gluconolactonase/LRE-like region domain-containing protein n=1 Tax=Thyridium curvatum TaxID=1093900 RepID=A0A507B2V6_9PEZI|nr:uncharacterized protein E0L32_007608 [Thyridium curvatum]TPX11629.1 hypothetical protein E0L32_007608 [Thyridium curvatum]
MWRYTFTFLSLACATGVAYLVPILPESITLPLPHRLVLQYAEPTWLENIAVRSNGDLLVTGFQPDAPLFIISDPASLAPKSKLLHPFGAVKSLTGITEVSDDLFVVVGGNFSGITPMPESFSAWSIDFRHHQEPTIEFITSLPKVIFPNGLTSPEGSQDVVLIADSTLGAIWNLNIQTGEYDIAVNVPELAAPSGASNGFGVNGVKTHGDFLYWTNSAEAAIYRIKIMPDGYPVEGAEAEMVARADAPFLDDFTIDTKGTIWATTNTDNRLLAIGPSGQTVTVAGAATEMTVAGDTAVAFGRGMKDKHILYVSTSGAINNPVNGTLVEGGKVVAIDTKCY